MSQPHIIKGTKVELKRAFPKELNNQYILNKSSKTKQKSQDRKIFVGGLPSNVNKISLKNFFSQYGEVEYCIVMTDKATDKPRGINIVVYITYIGFGFVVFKEQSSVDFCLKDTSNHRLFGKWIECKRANPKDKYEDEDNTFTITESNNNSKSNVISRQNSNNSNTNDNVTSSCSLSYSEYIKNQIPKNNKNKTPNPTSQTHSTPISKYKYNFRHIGDNIDKFEEPYDYNKEDESSNLMNLFVYQEDYQNQNNLKNDLTANIDGDNSNVTCYQDNTLFIQKNSFKYKDQVFHSPEIQIENDDEIISLTAQTSEMEDKITNDNSNIIISNKDKNNAITNKDNNNSNTNTNNNNNLKVNFQDYFNNSIQNPKFFSFFHFKLFDINGEDASTLSSYQNTTKITLFKPETESSSSDKDSDHSSNQSNQSNNDSRTPNNASNSLTTSSPGSNSITINSNNSKPSLNSSNCNSSKLSDSIVTIGSDYKDFEEEIKHDVNNAYYGPRIHKTFKYGFVNSFRPY